MICSSNFVDNGKVGCLKCPFQAYLIQSQIPFWIQNKRQSRIWTCKRIRKKIILDHKTHLSTVLFLSTVRRTSPDQAPGNIMYIYMYVHHELSLVTLSGFRANFQLLCFMFRARKGAEWKACMYDIYIKIQNVKNH
jgi:hypothetical protein